MATPIIMPRQGQSVETCIIAAWHFKKGEPVKEGDIILSYETDKASFDLEAPASGMLLEIFYEAGEEVPVLVNIGVIGKEGEPAEQFRLDKTGAGTTGTTASPAGAPGGVIPVGQPVSMSTGPVFTGTGKRRISPRARRMAEELKLPVGALTGSGPYGRIIVRDILQAGSSSPAVTPGAGHIRVSSNEDAEFSYQKLSNLRKIIAEKMHASLQQSAQLTHHLSADARKILACRAAFKSLPEGSSGSGVTINDIICYIVTRALLQHSYMNAHFMGDHIKTFSRVHLGFAVDTDRGLMVPVLKNADSYDLTEMSVQMKDLAARCKKGNIDPALLQSSEASFTVTNLGAYGIEMFTPVLNLPQAGILGINTIIKRPADLGEGVLGIVPFIGLSLTYDHRAVDGAPASAFLATVKTYIESFDQATI